MAGKGMGQGRRAKPMPGARASARMARCSTSWIACGAEAAVFGAGPSSRSNGANQPHVGEYPAEILSDTCLNAFLGLVPESSFSEAVPPREFDPCDAEPGTTHDHVGRVAGLLLPGREPAKPDRCRPLRSVSSIGVSTSSRKRLNLFYSGSRMLQTTQTYLVVLATQVASSV